MTSDELYRLYHSRTRKKLERQCRWCKSSVLGDIYDFWKHMEVQHPERDKEAENGFRELRGYMPCRRGPRCQPRRVGYPYLNGDYRTLFDEDIYEESRFEDDI